MNCDKKKKKKIKSRITFILILLFRELHTGCTRSAKYVQNQFDALFKYLSLCARQTIRYFCEVDVNGCQASSSRRTCIVPFGSSDSLIDGFDSIRIVLGQSAVTH